jgi:S-adenosyl methyltransferase
VHVHANALLTGAGNTKIVLADLREPEKILTHPKVRELIDFDQPVALLLVAILHFVTDDEHPAAIVAAFRDALPPGSYLALSHGTADFHTADSVSHGTRVYERATAPLVLRSHAQISEFFHGFHLVEPGLVQVPLWRPDGKPPRPRDLAKIAIYGGVGHRSA